MTKQNEIRVPDLGGASQVTVIEIAVAVGDHVEKDSTLMTVEGDKATMDIPASAAGVVEALHLKVGDKVDTGDLILTLKTSSEEATSSAPSEIVESGSSAENIATQQTKSSVITVSVPDFGSSAPATVIDMSVAVGDSIESDATLLTLEGEKATMDVPSPRAGVVKAWLIKTGDKVSSGDPILKLEVMGEVENAASSQQTNVGSGKDTSIPTNKIPVSSATSTSRTTPSVPNLESVVNSVPTKEVHAGPGVRRFAREFGVDLRRVRGSGLKSRILKQDVQLYIKAQLAQVQQGAGGIGSGLQIAPPPTVDFAKFGDIETIALNKIKRLTGLNLHRNWVTVPHVTQFDEADITELEKFRQERKTQAEAEGVKLTPLVFIMKAVVAALKSYPTFNASLHPDGEQLILKKYFHLGIAVDTPNGLVVPVIRHVDCKGVFELAKELAEISEKARTKGLTPAEMSGSCFTISSLGGIGGTAFTPIVNAPDVAILGVSRAQQKPVYRENQFVPRLCLPLSLSYDHRVIDGADGARFARAVANHLEDIRELIL